MDIYHIYWLWKWKWERYSHKHSWYRWKSTWAEAIHLLSKCETLCINNKVICSDMGKTICERATAKNHFYWIHETDGIDCSEGSFRCSHSTAVGNEMLHVGLFTLLLLFFRGYSPFHENTVELDHLRVLFCTDQSEVWVCLCGFLSSSFVRSKWIFMIDLNLNDNQSQGR